MRAPASLRARVAVLALFVAGGFACAQGTTTDDALLGTAKPATTNQPTEPPSESVPPASNDDGEEPGTDAGAPAKNDAGTTTGTDAGTPTDSGTSATDAGTKADSGTTATDAGACAKAPPSNACGVAPQCGCAANETCDVTNTTTGAVSCVLAGGGPQGSVCTTSSQCAKGLTCQFGACRPYCAAPGTTCTAAGTGVCFSPANAANATTPNLNVCAITCDPKNPSGACASNACLWFSADKQSDCNTPGPKTAYQACSSLADCAAGLACAFDPLSLGNACLPWCRLSGNDCGLFASCDDVYGANAPVVGGQKYGLCR